MKSGTRSKLTLVDRNGREIPGQSGEDEMAVEYVASPEGAESGWSQDAADQARHQQLVTFAAVSAGCAAAAIATGSYALWLSRRKMTDEALTSVRDILKTCQDRVTQMEEELSHLPSRSSSSTTSVA